MFERLSYKEGDSLLVTLIYEISSQSLFGIYDSNFLGKSVKTADSVDSNQLNEYILQGVSESNVITLHLIAQHNLSFKI